MSGAATSARESSLAGRSGRGAGVLGVATLLFWVSLYLYVPLVPGHARQLGATVGWIGLISGSYGIAQLVLRVPVGMWSDRIGRRRPFVLAGCALALASGLGFAVADGPAGLLAARLLGGLAATMWIAFTVLYASYSSAAVGAAMSTIFFANGAGVLVGQVAGPFAAARFGTQAVFLASAAVGGLAFALTLLAPERPAVRTPMTVRDMVGVAANRAVLTASLVGAAVQYLVHGAFYVFVFDWAQQRLGASAADLGTLALYGGVPAAVAPLLGRRLAERVGSDRVVVAGLLVTTLSVVAVPAAPDLAALFVLQAIGGLARGATMPLLLANALVAVPEEQGATAAGFFSATYSVGITAGPVVTGLVAEAVGLDRGFFVMGAIGLLAAAAQARAASRQHRDPGPPAAAGGPPTGSGRTRTGSGDGSGTPVAGPPGR